MAIQLAENYDSNTEAQLQVSISMADLFVEVLFYSDKHCTVLVTYTDSDGSTKISTSKYKDQEVKAVEAALRIATNFDSTGSEEDYKLAESIMPRNLPDARWIP